MNAASSLLFGWLVDRGHAGQIYLISDLGAFLGLLMLALPGAIKSIESEIWLVMWLVVLGAASAGGTTSIYLIYETLAYKSGFKNDKRVKLLAPSLLNVCFACGRILGPVFVGGMFMEHFGYYPSCLLLTGLMLLSSMLCAYVLITNSMLRKIYYTK